MDIKKIINIPENAKDNAANNMAASLPDSANEPSGVQEAERIPEDENTNTAKVLSLEIPDGEEKTLLNSNHSIPDSSKEAEFSNTLIKSPENSGDGETKEEYQTYAKELADADKFSEVSNGTYSDFKKQILDQDRDSVGKFGVDGEFYKSPVNITDQDRDNEFGTNNSDFYKNQNAKIVEQTRDSIFGTRNGSGYSPTTPEQDGNLSAIKNRSFETIKKESKGREDRARRGVPEHISDLLNTSQLFRNTLDYAQQLSDKYTSIKKGLTFYFKDATPQQKMVLTAKLAKTVFDSASLRGKQIPKNNRRDLNGTVVDKVLGKIPVPPALYRAAKAGEQIANDVMSFLGLDKNDAPYIEEKGPNSIDQTYTASSRKSLLDEDENEIARDNKDHKNSQTLREDYSSIHSTPTETLEGLDKIVLGNNVEYDPANHKNLSEKYNFPENEDDYKKSTIPVPEENGELGFLNKFGLGVYRDGSTDERLGEAFATGPYLEENKVSSKVLNGTYRNFAGFEIGCDSFWDVKIRPYHPYSDGAPLDDTYTPELPSYMVIDVVDGNGKGYKEYSFGEYPPVISYNLDFGTSTAEQIPLANGVASFPTGWEYNINLSMEFVDDAYKSLYKYFAKYFNTIYNPLRNTVVPYQECAFEIVITVFRSSGNKDLKPINIQYVLIGIPTGYANSTLEGTSSVQEDMLRVNFSIVGMRQPSNGDNKDAIPVNKATNDWMNTTWADTMFANNFYLKDNMPEDEKVSLSSETIIQDENGNII